MRNYLKVMPLEVTVILTVLMSLLITPAFAAETRAVKIFPADSTPYGRSYGEWMAAWQQWATSIPATSHPLFDTAPADKGQSGPVFFLGGKFCPIDSECHTDSVVRKITVPPGKALFFPIMDAEYSTVETGGGSMDGPNAIADINGLRQAAEQAVNIYTNLSLEVDGVKVRNLEAFRVQSSAFEFYLPEDDIFTAIGEGSFTPGYYFPGVDDGYYVMLEPLAAGKEHIIRFHGEAPIWSWVLDVTYRITVDKAAAGVTLPKGRLRGSPPRPLPQS